MIAGLFLLMTVSIGCVFFKQKKWAIAFFIAALVLGTLLFWHLMTDVININL